MINGWQFALLILAYFVILMCGLSFPAAADRGGDHPTSGAGFDELALIARGTAKSP